VDAKAETSGSGEEGASRASEGSGGGGAGSFASAAQAMGGDVTISSTPPVATPEVTIV